MTDYPRMLYHRGDRNTWIIVRSEEEETAQGPEWSRSISAALEPEEKPKPMPEPEPEEEPDEEEEEKPEEQPQEVRGTPITQAPPAARKRGRPPAHVKDSHGRRHA